ncbi:MAG: crossover junction endodeoxyribonuclease RuvC [Deltaproteobacteria bacterium]|nr:crossover junction endodeoxyribonuclease RuvC [Deltaproteobacteria bacterium]
MISIGVDTSLVSTGLVILIDGKLHCRETIKSKPTKEKTPKAELKRIIRIVEAIADTMDEYKPEVLVIEGLAFMARNTTALVQLSALNYMVRHEAYKRSIPFYVVAPTSLKKFITGKGNSQKDQMMLETYKRYGVSILDNNECDAYGLARIGYAMTGKDKIISLQQEVLDLLKKQND